MSRPTVKAAAPSARVARAAASSAWTRTAAKLQPKRGSNKLRVSASSGVPDAGAAVPVIGRPDAGTVRMTWLAARSAAVSRGSSLGRTASPARFHPARLGAARLGAGWFVAGWARLAGCAGTGAVDTGRRWMNLIVRSQAQGGTSVPHSGAAAGEPESGQSDPPHEPGCGQSPPAGEPGSGQYGVGEEPGFGRSGGADPRLEGGRVA